MSKKRRPLTFEGLENELWDVLQLVREKKVKPPEANAVTMAAKEICNITRLKLQYRALTSPNMKLKAGDVPLLDKN